MPAHRYMEENGLAVMLATKKLAGVALEVNLQEHVPHTPPPSANKAAHSGFETQRRHHQKSKTEGISGRTERTCVPPKKFLKKRI